MTVHKIRLAGPWEWQRESTADEGPDGDIRGPRTACQLPFPPPGEHSFSSGVRFYRGFHRPTGIGSNTIINVLVESHGIPLVIELNQNPLSLTDVQPVLTEESSSRFCRFGITEELKPFNEVCIHFSGGTEEKYVCLLSVALEIQE